MKKLYDKLLTMRTLVGGTVQKEGQEVDFCLVKDENITTLIEVKLSESKLSKNLFYFSDKYELKGVQLVKNLRQEQSLGRIDIRSANTFLRELFL